MIRKMLLKDLILVGELYKDANQFTNKKKIINWTKENMLKFPEYHLVYIKEDKIIGAISCTILNKNNAYIVDLAILSNYRNKGIGGKLIKYLINKLIKIKIKRVTLWVHWKSSRAIPFYYSYGFRIYKFEKFKGNSYIPKGEVIIHMEKEL